MQAHLLDKEFWAASMPCFACLTKQTVGLQEMCTKQYHMRQGRMHVHLRSQNMLQLFSNKISSWVITMLSYHHQLFCNASEAGTSAHDGKTLCRKDWLQHTMPYDMTSRILAGFKLVTTTTLLFCIWSTDTNLTKPLTTCMSPQASLSFLVPLPNTSRCSETAPTVKLVHKSLTVCHVHQRCCQICIRCLHLCKATL